MLWNGYLGSSGAVGGRAGLLGAYLEHSEHAALKLIKSVLKFGQKREVEALSNMEEALPWPACRWSMTVCWRDWGMTGLSWSMTTGPTVISECLCGKKSWMAWSHSSLASGAPVEIVWWRSLYAWSAIHAASSLCHETMLLWSTLMKAREAMMCPCRSSSWSVVRDPTTGGDIQAGGPSSSEYAAVTID